MQITFTGVTADYVIGPIRTPRVLDSIDLVLPPNSFTAVIGHTGSGKSSLLKVMNGLLIPCEGEVKVGNLIINQQKDKKALKNVRKKVGMVFQFPESQLFAETVEKDICFGPMNFGKSMDEARKIAYDVIKLVGLEPDILSKSPFSLSGGQKRRVAIAGVLAMEPDVLVLDEPGAGLDPKGKKEIMGLLTFWHKERNLTTVLVTHDMDDVARYANDVLVMDHGKVVMHGPVREIFREVEKLKQWNVDVPNARKLQLSIEEEMGVRFSKTCLTVEELADELIEVGLV
ncbi:energy-coupling factor transporter ATPase [Bacillaceae bacterium S4-13-58]